MSYEIGYIINMEIEGEYQAVAKWCNEVGTATIEEQGNGSYKIIDIEMPPALTLHEQAIQISLNKMDFFELVVGLTANTEGMMPISYDMIEQFINTYTGEAAAQVRLGFQHDTTIARSNHLLDEITETFGINSDLLDILFVNHADLLHKLRNNLPLA